MKTEAILQVDDKKYLITLEHEWVAPTIDEICLAALDAHRLHEAYRNEVVAPLEGLSKIHNIEVPIK